APEISLRWTGPTPARPLAVARGSKVPEARVRLAWKVDPPDTPATLVLSQSGIEQIKKTVVPDNGIAEFDVSLASPGTYDWRILDPNDAPLKLLKGSVDSGSFVVTPNYEAIRLLAPVVELESTGSRAT